MDGLERTEVGCLPQGQRTMGGGYRSKDGKGHESSSTRPRSKRERERPDAKAAQRKPRGLTTHIHNAEWRTRGVPTAAAATQTPTTAQATARTVAQTETKTGTKAHTD